MFIPITPIAGSMTKSAITLFITMMQFAVANVAITVAVAKSVLSRIPHLAQTSDAVNRQLSCFSSRYMNLLAVFQI